MMDSKTRKYAIPVNGNVLDAHFGHAKEFCLVDVVDGVIEGKSIVVAPPHEPGVLPRFIAAHGVTDVLAGGLGQQAIRIFNSLGINVFVGAPMLTVDEIVKGFEDKSISFNANYCDH